MITFKEWSDPEAVRMNIPFLIRIFEYVREDVKSDIELHKLVEKLMITGRGKILTMDDYKKVARR